jgi:hypothetical protein
MGDRKTGYIGNTFSSSSSLWDLLEGGLPQAIQLSADSTGCCDEKASSEDPVFSLIEATQQRIGKDDGPDSIVNGLEPNQLAGQRLADKLHSALEFHLSSGAHSTDLEVARIFGIYQAFRIGARRRKPQITRLLLPNPFVRSYFVVCLHKLVKQDLLAAQPMSRRSRCLCLHLLMHPLVGAVLVRTAFVYAFVLNAETHPPDIKPGQTGDAMRGKRLTIVRADSFRKSDLTE